MKLKIVLFTCFALVAFAFNSILCRLALRGETIDAASFTLVRLLSGAASLVVLTFLWGSRREGNGVTKNDSITPLLTRRLLHFGDWRSAFFLFAYAICFSFAYLGLTAGTGALVLFGSVQITMIGVSFLRGEQPAKLEVTGAVIAFAGLINLVFPGLAAPPLLNAVLMAAAGIAWGFYTLRGKGSVDPLPDTAGNFVRTVPMVIFVAIPFFSQFHLSTRGVLLAVISGAVTSGIGYAVWYAALKHHTATRAAVLQLSVPLITAIIGVGLLDERADARLLFAAATILGGIGLSIAARLR